MLPVLRRFAYLHGFASGPLSAKGVFVAQRFEERGLPFERPDLNRPSFARLSHDAALAAVDDMDVAARAEGARWGFVGSSLGGWLAARWAELHPARVDRLVLLCPGFDLAARWPVIFGEAAMQRWRREGSLELADGAGVPTRVHYAFYEESLRQPAFPEVPCPTLILHGTRDEVVPVAQSRRYVEGRSHVRLVELEGGDHGLMGCVDRIADEAIRFLTAPGPASDPA
jgi:pimeloyl-ACP methyl ester carboxylesterase